MEHKNLYLRHGIWQLRYRKGGRHIRMSVGTGDLAVARSYRDAVLARLEVDRWPEYDAASAADLLEYLRKGRERAISRDRGRGRQATLTPDDLKVLMARAAGRCELTGIPFSIEKAPGSFRRPLAPSIDRIDRDLPYSAANARLVCVCVNVAINEWGTRLFRRVALALLARENEGLGHSVGHKTT